MKMQLKPEVAEKFAKLVRADEAEEYEFDVTATGSDFVAVSPTLGTALLPQSWFVTTNESS